MKPDPQANHSPEIVDVLRRARDLLAGPAKRGEKLAHVVESHSFTASGLPCEPWYADAARWSLLGALAKFTMDPLFVGGLPPGLAAAGPNMPQLRREQLFDAAFTFLFAAAVLQAPQTVNGVNNRGWDQVRDLIDLAVLLAEHGATIMPMLVLPKDRHPSPELRKRLEEIVQARGASIQVPS